MSDLEKTIDQLSHLHPYDLEFQQAVKEIYMDIKESLEDELDYIENNIFKILTQADRIIQFRVCWEDDDGQIQVNRAWRVQHGNWLGAYKGGLRFQKDLKLDTLKFLAFEQCFKNALTDLPMGGAKGGSDFNPKGKSKSEIRRFCHAFMEELYRYIGKETDVPAGDIGVGTREIGYLFGKYLKLTNSYTGALTGKSPDYFGSCAREEATGHGCIYFLENVLNAHGMNIEDKSILISGSGNVALHCASKAISLGVKVVSLSDTKGTLYFKDGLTEQRLHLIKDAKINESSSLAKISERNSGIGAYYAGKKPWFLSADIACPCATQNEMSKDDALSLLSNGCRIFIEGANMPIEAEGLHVIQDNNAIYAPGKAANAGGVAVSGLEISQNAQKLQWECNVVETHLKEIMLKVHNNCIENIEKENGVYPYKKGANLYAFKKLADAIVAYGTL